MKYLYVTMMSLLILPFGSVQSSTWVKAVESGNSRIMVDTDSINITGNIVSVWYMRDFKKPMSSDKNDQTYKSAKVLNYFNCSSLEIAPAQWIKYEEAGGSGKIISNEKVITLEYGDIPFGETGKPLFDFVCKRIKNHKR